MSLCSVPVERGSDHLVHMVMARGSLIFPCGVAVDCE